MNGASLPGSPFMAATVVLAVWSRSTKDGQVRRGWYASAACAHADGTLARRWHHHGAGSTRAQPGSYTL